jgi:hypothetical protein
LLTGTVHDRFILKIYQLTQGRLQQKKKFQ